MIVGNQLNEQDFDFKKDYSNQYAGGINLVSSEESDSDMSGAGMNEPSYFG